jgi:hypothetical protein
VFSYAKKHCNYFCSQSAEYQRVKLDALADMAIPNLVIRRPSVVQVQNIPVKVIAIPNLVIRRPRAAQVQSIPVKVIPYQTWSSGDHVPPRYRA